MFHKTRAVINSNYSDGSTQNKLKALWKRYTILEAIENICNSWKEVKILTLTGVWQKLILTSMDDFEDSKTPAEEVTTDVQENWNWKWSLKMWPNRCNLMMKLQQMRSSCNWTKKVFSWDWNYSWWCCGEHCSNDNKRFTTVKVEKLQSGLRELTLILKEGLLWMKCYQISIACYGEIFCERKRKQCSKFPCGILRNCSSHLCL